MPTIYKSTDTDAPLMTGTTGSLISMLKACLVDGYGYKSPAGWAYEDVHVASYKALFTQGEMQGRARKKLYVHDDATNVGSANVWMCTDCTKVVSPVFTENFWTTSNTYVGVITKADQENGGAAAWMLVADSRSAVLLTKRSGWSPRGWAFTFFGDLASGMREDFGCCAAAGWTSYDVFLAYEAPARAAHNNAIGVFGDIEGVYAPGSFTWRGALGYTSGVADLLYPVNSYNRDTHIVRAIAADTSRYRGHIPFMWWPLAPVDNFPLEAVPDGIEVADVTGTRSLLHVQFGDVSRQRAFIELFGF